MILITGGAGFIGSHLFAELFRRGQKVRILDNLSTGKKRNLEEVTHMSLPEVSSGEARMKIFRLGHQAEFVYGDIRDRETCRQACQGVEYIFHEAALGSVQRSVEDPISSHEANATGTLNVLWAAKEAEVRRVIYASSSSVYGNLSGDAEEVMAKSEDLPPSPQSPYAATKLLGEIYCRLFANLYGLETVSLRYFNVFGPRQNPDSVYAAVIPKFISALRRKEAPLIYGDGNQSRDFTFVENVVRANLKAMEVPGISGEVFNIACGQRASVNNVFSSLQEIAGSSVSPSYGEGRSGEVRHSLAAIDRAQSRLGYQVRISLSEGLMQTWRWFQKDKGTKY